MKISVLAGLVWWLSAAGMATGLVPRSCAVVSRPSSRVATSTRGGGVVSSATEAAAASEPKVLTNSAFVFVKPHAVTEPTIELVREALTTAGVVVLSEGDIASEAIDEKKLVDQHYYAIASKATITPPEELAVPEDKFKEFFGEDWKTVLESGRAKTALDAGKALGLDGAAMDAAWGAAKDAGKIIKLGGGFYCGRLGEDSDTDIYTFNAFYMSMRDRFTKPGGSIHYFVVEWDPEVLAWADFRGQLLGPTDPAAAPAESIRGQIFAKWESLGLKALPNTGDNGVHASASPFEGLAEKMNWLQVEPKDDPFGAHILEAGLSDEMLRKWVLDPVVSLEDGARGSLFDALEDTDASVCAATIADLANRQ